MLRFLLFAIAFSTLAHAQNRREASLAEQKMCSEQAEKIKEDQGRFPQEQYIVSSHYSGARNACYVNLQMVHLAKNKIDLEIDSLLDGFEKVTYGTCTTGRSAEEQGVTTCWATDPNNKVNKKLPDSAAWRNFVEANYFAK